MKVGQRAVLAIRVHPRDNVAVMAADVKAGGIVRLDDGTGLETVEAVTRGSKVALTPIPVGAAVIRYGEEIGRATEDIVVGQHVHTHNLRRGE